MVINNTITPSTILELHQQLISLHLRHTEHPPSDLLWLWRKYKYMLNSINFSALTVVNFLEVSEEGIVESHFASEECTTEL